MQHCNCVETTIPSTPNTPTCVQCGNCLTVKSPILSNFVDPCGDSDTYDITTVNDYEVCDGAITYQILSFDTIGLASVTVSSLGVFTIETTNEAEVGQYYEIVYITRCSDPSIGAIGVIRVGIADPCNGVICADGETCNKCSGECEEITIDLNVDVNPE